jgi:exo-beta-1,3-glucanase (GH17 family)
MKYIAIVAAIFSTTIRSTEATPGVCYSPWHHGAVNGEVIKKDLEQVKQYFSGIRTFHAEFSGVNAVDAAAGAGLKIAVGIMMKDKNKIDAEIKAAVEGAKRNPGAVEAIYVGNENLKNAGFGQYSAPELVGYINQVKAALKGSPAEQIKVGTVQRITEWKECPDAKQVADASDVIGVNIYPFFTPGKDSPFEKFSLQWNSLTSQYPVDKLRITESGWPRAGTPFQGVNVPSQENAQKFFDDFHNWSQKQPFLTFYFMMYDLKDAPAESDFEKYFGLADVQGNLKLNVPKSNGLPEDTPATVVPATQAADVLSTQVPQPTINPVPITPEVRSNFAKPTPAPTSIKALCT